MKKPITLRVEVPSARPASFKLVERAAESYELFRSSRKLGTARAEEKGLWSATFAHGRKKWTATARSREALLRLLGTFILASEVRAAAAKPVDETDPALRVKGRPNAEEKLSLQFAKRAQSKRLDELDALIKECRRSIEPAK